MSKSCEQTRDTLHSWRALNSAPGGHWLQQYGESVYGTRGGPVAPRPWGVTTRSGNRVYVHILDWPDTQLFIPLKQAVRSARSLRDGRAVAVRKRPDGIELTLPSPAADEWDRMIRLDLLDGSGG
jgi:alpha-L-fucosidase